MPRAEPRSEGIHRGGALVPFAANDHSLYGRMVHRELGPWRDAHAELCMGSVSATAAGAWAVPTDGPANRFAYQADGQDARVRVPPGAGGTRTGRR